MEFRLKVANFESESATARMLMTLEKNSKIMSSYGKLNNRAVHCQSERHGCVLMDIEDVAALLAVVPNNSPKATLRFLWRNFAGFFKDPLTGMPMFVHE